MLHSIFCRLGDQGFTISPEWPVKVITYSREIN